MKLTKEILELAKTDNGGYTREQLACLGVVFVVGESWIGGVIGKQYDKKKLLKFVSLRYGAKPKVHKNPVLNKRVKKKHRKKKITKKNRGEYLDPRWREKRKFILERDEYKCKECGATECELHVHHLKYYGKYIWSVNDRDLITLCKKCHNNLHAK